MWFKIHQGELGACVVRLIENPSNLWVETKNLS